VEFCAVCEKNLAVTFTFSLFNSLFVHIKYTSNMAAWFCAELSDVSAPHVYLLMTNEENTRWGLVSFLMAVGSQCLYICFYKDFMLFFDSIFLCIVFLCIFYIPKRLHPCQQVFVDVLIEWLDCNIHGTFLIWNSAQNVQFWMDLRRGWFCINRSMVLTPDAAVSVKLHLRHKWTKRQTDRHQESNLVHFSLQKSEVWCQ